MPKPANTSMFFLDFMKRIKLLFQFIGTKSHILPHRLSLTSYLIKLESGNEISDISMAPLLLPSGIVFNKIYQGPRKENLIGINKLTGQLIKIELTQNPRKKNTLIREIEIMQILNSRGCISCPIVLESGSIDRDRLVDLIRDADSILADVPEKVNYMVQEYIQSAEAMPLADLILAIVEQKNLGVYHGDIKPANIRFNRNKGVCVLVDYDQAEELDNRIVHINVAEFLEWCDKTEERKYKLKTWRRHFPSLEAADLHSLLRHGSFNLAETTLFKYQATTNYVGKFKNLANKVYQSISERDVYADGIRDLQDRIQILDTIIFSKNERVLDVGCNAGLLCHYLHDQGCQVTGAELDSFMVTAAGVISRITQRNIAFTCFDLDEDAIPGHFDTIMLFSVLHHSSNIPGNARKIAAACNRIIIECRLVESGKKPNDAAWQETSKWNYSSLDDLIHALQELFPGFLLRKNHGMGGKNRYILEFVKKGGMN